MSKINESVLKSITSNAIPLHRSAVPIATAGIDPLRKLPATSSTSTDYDAILKAIGPDTKVVMIGEASHGTEEFYRHRAEITKRLIMEKGFNLVAVEADWPDAYRVNRYVRTRRGGGLSQNLNLDQSAREALSDFQRFPRWMWRNTVVEEFIDWLKTYNQLQEEKTRRVGFYGLDMYSFQASRQAVLSYLDKVDPEAARRTRSYYACFDQYGDEVSSNYSWAVGLNLSRSCKESCEKALRELVARGSILMEKDTLEDRSGKRDRLFYAQQNAKVVKSAEDYYRNMLSGSHVTWNIRDTHMCNTLIDLMAFLASEEGGSVPEPKSIIWAHNSHLGDASQTDAGWESSRRRYRGGKEVNLGQLIRKHWGMEKTFSIGFSTHNGTVTAAYEWDEEPESYRVRDSLPESWENVFHRASESLAANSQSRDFALIFRSTNSQIKADDGLLQELNSFEPKIQRAIGVVYRPETERQSHYFGARVTRQFDAMIHIDTTSALPPLDKLQGEGGMTDETYPTGL